jgi:LacI family transcriptional regulator
VEGFIFTPPCDNSAELTRALQELKFPFVQLTPHERCNDCLWVAATDEQGTYEAACHLLELGHTRIGFIQGNRDHQASWDRLHGYERALREAGIEPDEGMIKQGNWKFESGLECARELLVVPQPPRAIMASNDETAAGVIQAAWERRWHCPEQISVIGFDDVPLARQLCPPLTTVKQPIYEIATAAMSMLVEKIIPGLPVEKTVEVPTRLVIRHSTAPYAAHRL